MSTPPVDVKSIFEKALEITDPSARAAYLHAACGDNNALRAEIEGLLTALERAGNFLNRGPNPDASTGAFIPPEPPSPSIPTTGTTGTFDSAPVGPLETDSYVSPPRQQGPSYVSPPRQQGTNSGEGVSLGVVIAGKYKLIEEIGEGGMGNVFLAQQTEPVKRLVAVKVIKPGMDSKAVLARFEAERQALAMMDHPNIARVLDAGATEDGRPFFVMELVKGVPIIKFCDNRKLTPRQRLELFVPVCQAIQHAHQKASFTATSSRTTCWWQCTMTAPCPK